VIGKGLHNYEVDANEPIGEDKNDNDMFIRYERVALNDKIIEIQFTYHMEATEGGAVLLRAMADTIRPVE